MLYTCVVESNCSKPLSLGCAHFTYNRNARKTLYRHYVVFVFVFTEDIVLIFTNAVKFKAVLLSPMENSPMLDELQNLL